MRRTWKFWVLKIPRYYMQIALNHMDNENFVHSAMKQFTAAGYNSPFTAQLWNNPIIPQRSSALWNGNNFN